MQPKRSPQRIPIRSMILHGQETLQRQGTMQLPRQPVITFIRQMPMNIWSRKSCRSYCSSKRYCCLKLRLCKCCIAHRRNLVPYIILRRSTALNYIRDCVRLLGSIRFMRRYVWSRLCLTVRYVFSTDHRPDMPKET